ncbi:hypothetical protein EJP82_11285 [Paenibacillus anaericanus]|uniref:Uncharacterized protein n=1 Tax=Paenibacillus anaericanus TaxID=170367 RepID=A0A3S1BPF9_9BACL|nr:hypothetical protein [Paenibacillus anaericanus]RUT46429.1 hypothetical protein EJP82_11285 [Paenibacillus anaericanus]
MSIEMIGKDFRLNMLVLLLSETCQRLVRSLDFTHVKFVLWESDEAREHSLLKPGSHGTVNTELVIMSHG